MNELKQFNMQLLPASCSQKIRQHQHFNKPHARRMQDPFTGPQDDGRGISCLKHT